jgi:hypothetical protein
MPKNKNNFQKKQSQGEPFEITITNPRQRE